MTCSGPRESNGKNASRESITALPARYMAPAQAILYHFLPNNATSELVTYRDITIKSHIQTQLSTSDTL